MEEQQKKYKLAYIQKEIAPSDRTKEVIFQQADIFVSQVKDLKSFEKLAQEKKIAIQVAQIEKEATQVGTIKHAREFVRWLYTDAKIGKVSRLFEIGNHYVVAVPIAHHPAGSLVPIETVKESIMNKILNQRKSAIIKSKLLPLLELPLEKIAAAYDTNLSINVATALKMNDKQIPAIGMAAKTICSAFGLATGQQSRPIVDESGVFIIRINKREMPANVNATLEKEKTRLLLRAQQWQPYQIMEAMEELLHVKDFRYKYY
jgi:peptidyl-prolyl cis-trans isomerase D